MGETGSNNRRTSEVESNGFALVITLSLMVLLTVVALGLLTLSTITLRASGQGDAMATARGNARLALLMALGELQKSAGPDRRITARADILEEEIANPRLTGVWDSWEISATKPPVPADYEKAARDEKFRAWLVSHPDPAATSRVDFASQVLADPVTLWGKGSLGEDAPPGNLVRAGKVPFDRRAGAFAWAVLDEGLKVRVNTPYADGASNSGEKIAQLGAGERPGTEFIPGLAELEREFFERAAPEFAAIEKGISNPSFQLAAENLAGGGPRTLKPLAHDITTHSVGLFTDAARGGLKQDFHLLTNSNSLPPEYLVKPNQSKGVYESRLGMTPSSAPSDPSWASLWEFARLHRDKVTSSAGVPVVKAQAPAAWAAAATSGTSTTVNRKPPPGVVLLPTIAKVQMLFSLIGRDLYDYPAPPGGRIPADAPIIHQPQGGHFKGTKYEYDLHLLYTPIVTLHNPYDVALEFTNLRVEFVHVPLAVQVFRNDIAQSNGLVPVETMFADNENGERGKVFGMNLKTKVNDKPGTTTFRLLPGEVKMFSPYLDPARTYRQDLGDRKFWDIYVGSGITNEIDAIPGWRGDGIGYDCDWLAGNQQVNGNAQEGHWESCYGLARDDRIHVLFAPLAIPLSNNKFIIQMSASLGTSSARTVVSAIEINYESATGLQDSILGKGRTLRFPKTGAVRGVDLVDHSTVPISGIKKVKPFALLSVQAKSTSGGRDAGNEDGRLATKPWSFAHPVIGASSAKVVSEHTANHSHEIDLQLLELGKGTSNLLQLDSQDRSSFISGHTGFNGVKFGAAYEIPLVPIQSLPGLNGANPGGGSGYLPRFAIPVGNSWAHPLIAPDKITRTVTGGNYLDHSFLLNLALFDGYYFSGLADQTGQFAQGKSTTVLATGFSNGQTLDDPRLLFHRPGGRPAPDFVDLTKKPTAHSNVAAWQLLQGPFNINSTSVLAWKAMLASIHDSQAILNQVNPAASFSKLADLPDTGPREARISRFRLPASASAEDGADPRLAYWLGPREFSDAQLQTLAENIVKQVRLRGPFLSLAEFVNRRLGSDATAQRGALQQAIDDSDLNQALAAAANAGFEIPDAAVTNYKYANAAAGSGPSYQGAPGFLSQSDLLGVLGNAATPRSDTFTIRGYGEARDSSGNILASATCEAVVQRFPEWIDPEEAAELAPADLQREANKIFGRRFQIVSFRWIGPKEV